MSPLYQSVLQNASSLFCVNAVLRFFSFGLPAEGEKGDEGDDHDWYADDCAGEVLDC